MKNKTILYLAAAALAVVPGALQAQPDAHYAPGLEGIKGASLPPPGVYFRDYNYLYVADQANDANGNKVTPSNFQALTYVNAPRVIWITDAKVLGGNVGVDALLPIVYSSLKAGPLNSAAFSIGDFFMESTLSWHPQQFDLAVGVGIWTPTGDSTTPAATHIGSGFWTTMLTAGGTWYPDAEKTWAISVLNRYEFNSEERDTHDTPGQALTTEWGISKSLIKTLDAGVVGYYQEKVTGDTGSNPAGVGPHNQVAAIGPEVNLAIPSVTTFVSLRYNYEFLAENRAQGHAVTLTLTKKF